MPHAAPVTGASAFDQFNWQPQPAAQAIVNELVADVTARCPGAALLAQRLRAETGTRLVDWADHLVAPDSGALRARLLEAGFARRPIGGVSERYVHDGGMFPALVLCGRETRRLGVKVEYVSDFAAAWGIQDPIEGEPLAPLRLMRACAGGGAELWAVERHGYRGLEVVPPVAPLTTILRHAEAFRRRRRDCGSDAAGIAHAAELVRAAIDDLGVDLACDLFFAAEREYWQRRNRAARVQKARQDVLGMGWANHDHHTYRSSRAAFADLVGLWELLGLSCRERFYAGAEAGWGAQVMEQPVTGIITFNDVDLTPDELMGDFAHQGLRERHDLGTVGLWCALHGEAVLQAGMHHLEAQFDWHALRDQLEAEAGVRTMEPFTTFPFLRQAFTEGERWAVRPERIEALLKAGRITPEQAGQFRAAGAIGSHLENLERNDGFKGFNQKGVSEIIARTDPRRQAAQPVGA
ncbi:MAG TPA: hypothetical protein VD963_10120 [Phycisphaerales bacterium]|nr:hypothetical protein [Phycisphaerales bacterium]